MARILAILLTISLLILFAWVILSLIIIFGNAMNSWRKDFIFMINYRCVEDFYPKKKDRITRYIALISSMLGWLLFLMVLLALLIMAVLVVVSYIKLNILI